MAYETTDSVVAKTRYFYVGMAATIALFAFGAFAPTYWVQLPAGTFVGTTLVHIHAAVFFGWPFFLLSQAWLAGHGRMTHHRASGMAGIGLASALVILGVATAIGSLNRRLAMGYGDAALSFLIVPLTSVLLCGGFFVAAIANIRRPEAHKRLMLLATMSLLGAAIDRVRFFLVAGHGPGLRPGLDMPAPVANLFMPQLALLLLILAGVIYDWRTRGRPHPVWLVGAAVIVVALLLRAPISATQVWKNFAQAAAHIAG